MTPSYKPEGYDSASPYLIVYRASRVMEFLAHAFDAVETRRFAEPDGTWKRSSWTRDSGHSIRTHWRKR